MTRRLTLLACFAALACMPPPEARVLRPGSALQGPVVVVLENKPSSLNNAVLEPFSSGVEARIVAFTDVGTQPAERLATAVRAERPNLILALGPQAVQFAHAELPEVQVVFALVLNYRAQHLQGEGNKLVGIAMENSLVSEFTQFKMVYPGMRRLIVPYCVGNSEPMLDEARKTLGSMGLAMQPLALQDTNVLPQIATLKHWPGDVLWLASDTLVLRNAKAFIQQGDKINTPVFASVSGVLARAGAVAAIEVDIPSLGAQAAGIATLLLTGQATAESIGVQAPNGTQLVVNLATAQRQGMDIPLQIMPFIGESISEAPQE